MYPIDSRLMDVIRSGNCVAFVGAGYSAAAGLPSWKELIGHLAQESQAHLSDQELRTIRSLLDSRTDSSGRELEMAAQLLWDALGEQTFCDLLSKFLRRQNLPPTMQRRLKYLRGIPFRAIVTTNFDPLIPGLPPSSDAYRKLLRPRRDVSPWREAFTRVALGKDPLFKTEATESDALVVQLHGRIDNAGSMVLTRSQYRHRLYADPAYLTALRSLLATSSVLFLGYSLTDAYLNELRSELVEVFYGTARPEDPIAWAVIEGVSEVACRYYETHEGLGVIPYQAHGQDHSAFDAILKSIFDETNPIHILGTLLRGKRVLWFDPNPDNNDLGRELLRAAFQESGETHDKFEKCLVETCTLDDTLVQLMGSEAFDLVISHWGYGLYNGSPNGAELLRRISE